MSLTRVPDIMTRMKCGFLGAFFVALTIVGCNSPELAKQTGEAKAADKPPITVVSNQPPAASQTSLTSMDAKSPISSAPPVSEQSHAKPVEPASGSGIHWLRDLSAAAKEAKASNKLILVDFYAEWCKWCKALDREAYVDPAVVALSKKYVMVKLDTDHEGREAGIKYHIESLPTVMIMKPDQTPVTEFNYRPADQFAFVMEQVFEGNEELNKAEATLKSNPNDKEALLAKLKTLIAFGHAAECEPLITKLEKMGEPPSKMTSAYVGMGGFLLRQQQMDKATAYLKKAVETASEGPAKVDATIYYGMALATAGKVQEGKDQFDAALKSPSATKGQIEAARQLFDKAKEQLTGH